jgi:phytoene dehydrogenase-like protein
MTRKIDTVIVGGGIGGTAVGALLASSGQRVALVDKNSVIGGRCASYQRDGFVVDVGVHLFGLSGNGPLGEVCRRCGEPDAIEWVLARRPGVGVHFKGKTQPLSRSTMMANVNKANMGSLANLMVSLVQMRDAELNTLWYTPLRDWVSKFTDDREAHAFFAMLCGIYFCITPAEASTAEFIIAFRDVMKHKSSGYPKGGCGAIPRAFQAMIEKHGGEVKLSCPAERIIIEDGKAVGVVAGGETILADRVISNADIKRTVGGLAEARHFPAEYVKRVQDLTWTAHVLGLKVALDTVITDQKMIMYLPDLPDEEIEKLQAAYIEGRQVEMPDVAGGMLNSPSNFDPDLAPPGRQLITFGTKCEPGQDWNKWARICMNALEDVFPDIKGHVLWSTIDSPDTVAKYAGEAGNVIGVGQTVDQIHERRPAHETPVKNLYLCSAEAGGHGIGTELAASSALELADKLLGAG